MNHYWSIGREFNWIGCVYVESTDKLVNDWGKHLVSYANIPNRIWNDIAWHSYLCSL